MLFKSATMTEASGSVGGIVASHNRGGMYFRARVIPTDPNTPQQALMRGVMAGLVVRWLTTLSAAQRAAWEVYAANIEVLGPLGDPLPLTGQQQFIRSNAPRLQTIAPLILDAPTIFNFGILSLTSITSATEAGQTASVAYDNTDEWANIAGGFLFIYLPRPVNPTINWFRGPYRLAATVIGDPIPPVSPEVVTVPFPIAAGQRLYGRARASLADGRLTAEQFIGPIAVAA